MRRTQRIACWIVAGTLGTGCLGDIGETPPGAEDPGEDPAPVPGPRGGPAGRPTTAAPGAPPPSDPLALAGGLGPSGVRRLSREELAQTIQDLLGVDVRDRLELMPSDPVGTLFDNSYRDQVPSAALLEGVRAVADAAARRVLADPALRERLIGCTPAAPDDEACLRRFVERFGRRAFRRPLGPDEVARYTAVRTLAAQARDFHVAVEVVLRAVLQDVQFLYRIEIGEPVAGAAGLVRLTGFEVAARLSYLLWGSAPSEGLLDQAARHELATPAAVRAAAAQMLSDRRARARVRRLHALWLNYEEIPAPEALARALRRESDALVDRVVFEQRGSWLDLFRARETFVDRTLATHYGVPAPAGGTGWAPQAPSTRQGILGHGAVLTNGQKFGKTSIVQRGQFVLKRMLCREIPDPPPELDVDVDVEPKAAGACKADNVRAHSTVAACAACHRMLDGIGFGLENYDLTGRHRTRDETGCAVEGAGELPGEGGAGLPFAGPAGLADLLVASGGLDACFVRQLYEFALGRPGADEDEAAVAALARRFRDGRHRLTDLLLDLVGSNAFLHRVLERS